MAPWLNWIETAPWLNWIEQPPPKGQVAGSNPAGVASSFLLKKELNILLVNFAMGTEFEAMELYVRIIHNFSLKLYHELT